MKVGVLGLQGAIQEHMQVLASLMKEQQVIQVKTPSHLEKVSALIIPGGESTVISRLMLSNRLFQPTKKRGEGGMPIMGTCAGMVLLARKGEEDVERTNQKLLELMRVKVRRNAFGRQKESFETPLEIPVIGEPPFPGVFIRAPIIAEVLDRNKVEVIGRFQDKIVAARQDNLLALSFHPELASDTRLHRYFLDLI